MNTAAAEAGLTLVTHLFNAMAPLHHRQPGLIGHTLGTEELTAGLIVDGVHLAPQVVTLALRALGPERLVLVSDAVAAMGLGPGTHHLGARTVTAGPDGVRRSDGTLAGSDLTLDRAMRNLIDQTGCSLGVAVGAASSNPARVLGEDDRGRLEPGAVADVVVLDPSDLRVVATFCRGHLAHCVDDASWRHQPVSA
ncbi:MAG: amidohydrolase family protein [Actinomycetota bacterium]